MKDWNGNKKSTEVMLGMKTAWHPEERAEHDFYATDPAALESLLNRISLPGSVVWEPACGAGNLSEVLKAHGYQVISTDLVDRGYEDASPCLDFLAAGSEHLPNDCRCILTNPPYKHANDFILHAMELLPEGGVYIALHNLSYLTGKARHEQIYAKGLLERIYVFSGRINCYKNNEQTGHRSPVNYAWYMYRKPATGERIVPQIEWL